MPDLEIESLLSPLSADRPCGEDLEYDPGFAALQESAAGQPERQYGETIIPAEPPDWPVVREQALALAHRTRDLRVAVWLTRSAARVDGLGGAVQGLQLLHALLERHWEHVHPVLDADDHDVPTASLNALGPLVHEAGLADLRSAALTAQRGAPRVRDLELAFGRVDPLPGEFAPTPEGLTPAVAEAQSQVAGLAQQMQDAWHAVQGITKVLDERLGAGSGLDLTPLLKLMRCVAQAGSQAQGQENAAVEGESLADGVPAPRHSGAIQSRDDAINTLQRVCDWIERNEPSNPAPLLIQRAQRLMKKNFLEIIRDLVPDGLDQIERLAGPGRE